MSSSNSSSSSSSYGINCFCGKRPDISTYTHVLLIQMPSRFDALWVDPLNYSSFNVYHAYERKHSLVSKRDKAICNSGTTIVITIVTGKIWYVTNVIVRNKG